MIYVPTAFIVLLSVIGFGYLVLFLIWEDSKGVSRFDRIRKRFVKGVK